MRGQSRTLRTILLGTVKTAYSSRNLKDILPGLKAHEAVKIPVFDSLLDKIAASSNKFGEWSEVRDLILDDLLQSTSPESSDVVARHAKSLVAYLTANKKWEGMSRLGKSAIPHFMTWITGLHYDLDDKAASRISHNIKHLSSDIVPLLARSLQHNQPTKRYNAARLMTGLGDDALGALTDIAVDGTLKEDFRKLAIGGIGKIGNQDSLTTLLKAIENTEKPSKSFISVSLTSIGQLKNREATPILKKWAAVKRYPISNIYNALAEVGDPSNYAFFLDVVRNSKHPGWNGAMRGLAVSAQPRNGRSDCRSKKT